MFTVANIATNYQTSKSLPDKMSARAGNGRESIQNSSAGEGEKANVLPYKGGEFKIGNPVVGFFEINKRSEL